MAGIGGASRPGWKTGVSPPSAMSESDQCLSIGFGLPVVPEGRNFSILLEMPVVARHALGGTNFLRRYLEKGCEFSHDW
jgi:hypothetical protein